MTDILGIGWGKNNNTKINVKAKSGFSRLPTRHFGQAIGSRVHREDEVQLAAHALQVGNKEPQNCGCFSFFLLRESMMQNAE